MGTSALTMELFLEILVGFMMVVLAVSYGIIRYNRWKRYKEFATEMKALDLDPNTEGTLAGMVKRYSMDEPVNILFSARLFDEMATAEILRVLSSAGSQQSKQEFIDTVYNIRNRTYHPEWKDNVDHILVDKESTSAEIPWKEAQEGVSDT